ncbi:MAG: 1-acyl-sn-glycerol-3-phosphate acyltransferase [Clostridia bacterium]|nr:1-acyl-sn-glycerol-3-phosphate acyltransferase [Clostridia bacterium]
MAKDEERLKVIQNIKKSAESGNFNSKVELGDPVITDELREQVIVNFDTLKKKIKNKMNAWASRKVADIATEMVNKTTEIEGMENIEDLHSGAIITCNHFSMFDNTVIRHLMRRIGKEKKLYIIVQETNMLMTGAIGWLMKNCYTIPLSMNSEYIVNNFNPTIKKILDKKGFILIYPEEEMWFNYKRPRTHKIGAYHYACKFDVPVVPCFIEMKETEEVGKDGFYKVDYKLHVLEPIYPNKELEMRARKEDMRQRDYQAKVDLYEKIYGRSIEEKFNVENDIAGW